MLLLQLLQQVLQQPVLPLLRPQQLVEVLLTQLLLHLHLPLGACSPLLLLWLALTCP
jgi:hypothetical protein